MTPVPAPVWSAGATELAGWVRGGEVAASEIVEASLERIARMNPDLNAFVFVDADGARAQAEALDRALRSGVDPGPLAGVPIGVKDLEDVEGMPTRRGSLLHDGSLAAGDSTQVSRLRRAGAVVVGKTATPEMGSSIFTWSRAHGTTRNPWNAQRTPGGSSGGSAAAVAAGLVPLATGSDGGGSLRVPAAFCGLVTLKPTFGTVPRGPGRVGIANISVYGPLGRTVADLSRYLDQVAGHHPADPWSLPYAGLGGAIPLEGLRAAWSTSLGFGACEAGVATVARSAAERLFEATGIAETGLDVSLPDAAAAWLAPVALDCFSDLIPAWEDRLDELTPVVAFALELARTVGAREMAEAYDQRNRLLSAMNQVFEEVDLLVTPATCMPAFAAEGPLPYSIGGVPAPNPMAPVAFSYPFNLTGHPAVVVPAGLDEEGMPTGLQIAGRRFSEGMLLSVARAWEQAAPWPRVAPAYDVA